MNIELLFPTAIGIEDNTTDYKYDHQTLINLPYTTNEKFSSGHFEQTVDSYVLDNNVPNLRSWIQTNLNVYASYALSTDQKLKITQSWCIKHNDAPQHVFPHSHPNSIISGAYYVAADDQSAKLKFHRTSVSTYPSIQWQMDPDKSKDAPWNWDWQKIPVTSGRLVLFPSQMMHSVEDELNNKDVRCVLSFNTWFEGSIGNADRFTQLGAIQ